MQPYFLPHHVILILLFILLRIIEQIAIYLNVQCDDLIDIHIYSEGIPSHQVHIHPLAISTP